MNLNFEELVVIAENLDADLYGNVGNENLFVYLEEEINELKQKDVPSGIYQKFNQAEELGDVLFCLIAFARQNNININESLSLTICKLQDRIKRKKEWERNQRKETPKLVVEEEKLVE